MSNTIHQEITFKASPERVYEALMNDQEHGAFTGAPAEISREAGGEFSCHGGQISGRNIELEPNKRIVQAWRAGNWGEGVYSLVKVELAGGDGETRLTLDHTGCPEGTSEHLDGGWHKMYWEPLEKYLGS